MTPVAPRAIILAAGRGSRMKHLTDEQPKCLAVLRGKPLLQWQTEALRDAGIQDIAIVTGYQRERLQGRGLTEFHNPAWAQTNMVSSLACAQAWLNAGPCIVSYSDIFYAPEAVSSLLHSSADLAITYDPHWLQLWAQRFENPLDDAETFKLNTQGCLTEIGHQPEHLDQVQGQYMGLLRFTPTAWAEVQRLREAMPPAARDKAHMTGTLQQVIAAQRLPIHALPYTGAWGEVDSADDLQLYNEQ
ncbi:NTP transferase domain-containing protein [Ideonella sp.]|jgi:choline kinase|uniref:phosphocholine cytidylyltransferase family protein n=1 Tax=Ideonella sp. TaxID=1929293 RepID=UPI0037C0EE19